jgi:hypothetical protein
MPTAKQAAREIIDRLPDIAAGRTIPHERVKTRPPGND